MKLLVANGNMTRARARARTAKITALFTSLSLVNILSEFLPPLVLCRVGAGGRAAGSWLGSWPRSRRRAGSCPTPLRAVHVPRNRRSILLSERHVYAPEHKVS